MKRPKRAEVFRLAEERLQPGAEVVILGPVSRTWYEDRGTLVEMLLYLDALNIVPHVVGGFPFILCAQEAVAHAKTAVNIHQTPAWSDVVAPVEKPDLMLCLLSRTGDNLEDVSPLCAVYRGRGVPALCIDADERVRWVA